MNELVLLGEVLREIRIRKGKTLRVFCIEKHLDAIRYSLIERGELKPMKNEMEEYLSLVGPFRVGSFNGEKESRP